MSGVIEVEVISLEGGSPRRRRRSSSGTPPGEVDRGVKAARKKAYKGQGTKVQTQVPREWRQRVMALAREQGVRESDVLRTIVGKALGILS